MLIRTIDRRIARCPDCGGNAALEEDEDGLRIKCMMCSRSASLRTRAERAGPEQLQVNPGLNAGEIQGLMQTASGTREE